MSWVRRILMLDERLSEQLYLHDRPLACRWVVLFLAHSGDSPLWLLIASLAMLSARDHHRPLGWRLLIGIVGSGITTTTLKLLFRRHRPSQIAQGLYSRFDQHALPSGHASRTACLAILLTPYVSTPGLVLLVLWVILVGVSRVILKAHFALDILSGWVTGVITGLLINTFVP
jgi:undecaprenyl-diphosphatase